MHKCQPENQGNRPGKDAKNRMRQSRRETSKEAGNAESDRAQARAYWPAVKEDQQQAGWCQEPDKSIETLLRVFQMMENAQAGDEPE